MYHLNNTSHSLRPSAHERFFASAAAGMRRSVLNGNERRTTVSLQRFSKRNMLHFLCGAARWPHSGWRWQWNTKEQSARVHERQNNRTASGLRLSFQASTNVMDLDFKISDSERLITEVEERPALYN